MIKDGDRRCENPLLKFFLCAVMKIENWPPFEFFLSLNAHQGEENLYYFLLSVTVKETSDDSSSFFTGRQSRETPKPQKQFVSEL